MSRRSSGRASAGRISSRTTDRPAGPCYTPPPTPVRVASEARIAAAAAQMSQEQPVTVLDEIVQDQLRSDLPELPTGDTVKVSAKAVDGNRGRIQGLEGTVMRLRGGGITRSITVRRIASGVGVERTFKVNSPRIE